MGVKAAMVSQQTGQVRHDMVVSGKKEENTTANIH